MRPNTTTAWLAVVPQHRQIFILSEICILRYVTPQACSALFDFTLLPPLGLPYLVYDTLLYLFLWFLLLDFTLQWLNSCYSFVVCCCFNFAVVVLLLKVFATILIVLAVPVLFGIVHVILHWQMRLAFQKLERSVATNQEAEKENQRQVCYMVGGGAGGWVNISCSHGNSYCRKGSYYPSFPRMWRLR